MAEPTVHVLVINWNGLEHLDACFRSLVASEYANARFVLVDNGSNDESIPFVQDAFGDDARVEVLALGDNLGWSGGNNAGMERALSEGADYILLLNNDTRIEPDALSKLVDLAESDPAIGALAPKLLLYDDPQIINSIGLIGTTIGAAWDRGIGRLDSPRWDGHLPVLGVCGAGFFLRGEALKKTGLLPSDFEIYLDDLDLSLRIRDAGYRILACPEAVIHHKFSATMGEGSRARRKYYLNTRNRGRLVLRNFPANRLPMAAFDAAVGEARAVARAMADAEVWRVAAHVKSWISTAAYLPKAYDARKHRRSNESGLGMFWDLIQARPSFFPGTEFPRHGWYAPREIAGDLVRPISRTATYEHTGGPLEVLQVNPYPHIRTLSVRVRQNDTVLTTLTGSERHISRIDAEPGTIVFESSAIFEAEETGLAIDVGGWIDLRMDGRSVDPVQ